ncbi:DNA-binding Lrp family transcriptional regulator [Kineosphaera limosa]|uniref:Putative AsnC family transcriptional regulator n=1 Tax=Kineosphaera limosa NBRC 100340 TaxID=1184609 RepID=K6VLZ9_9MICO|nr:Lrp/AsnC family transcriptional regulator [Kineosphaera limosa]NYE01087.1 DNA-binding Lrp family transcriptional regulator [Kineosphaera limosa]GAB97238.1 putative AsnC family transcriptional regulator [Kineosphaera limosa NBRC 100340]
MPRNPPTRRQLPPGPPPTVPPALDDIDIDLLRILQSDGRRSIAALARDLGLAESTCAGRVRSLTTRGIVRGYIADVDPAAVGYAIEAMIAVSLSGQSRAHYETLRDDLAQVPGVIAIYNTSGTSDFVVHIAAAGADALRDFLLDHVSNRPGVLRTETSLLFEATRGIGLLPR